MATNPMQKKSRLSFLAGMVVMLLIAALVVALLYMKIRNQQDQIKQFEASTQDVYVLSQDVKSGQIITAGMCKRIKVSKTAIPSDATNNIAGLLENVTITDSYGRTINPPTTGKDYYYYSFQGATEDTKLYRQGDENPVTVLQEGDKVYYTDPKTKQNVNVEIEKFDAAVAKIDMKANAIVTRSALSPSGEKLTDDLRKEEYNVIALPVDLAPGEYVDVRLMLPNGQNYVVTSKKEVSIPIVNGQYLADTIQMNLTEEEILILSCAIVENYQIDGSKLYATRYTEAGIQEAATITYFPNNDVSTLISNDPNAVLKAINGIKEKRQSIRDSINASVSKNGKEENVGEKTETSITSTLEQRQNYLLTLPAVQ